MTEPGLAEQDKIDYNAEYTTRFEEKKKLAEAKGLKYEYPSKAGIGWKIHLAVPHLAEDPLTKRIADFIHENRLIYKVGGGGSQEGGKGMTIYVGDRDTTEDIAEALVDKFGDEIPEQRGEALIYDMQISGGVWARFENSQDYTRNPRLREFGPHKYDYDGPEGVSYLSKEWDKPSNHQLSPDKDRLDAIDALAEDYGAFFTGTRNHPI